MNRTAAPLAAFAGYGIELEYMIVDRDSLAVLPIADALLKAMAARRPERDTFGWSNELVLHLLEVKNPQPSFGIATLANGFQEEVAQVNAILAELGGRLMPGAMHPWMDPVRDTRLWPHQDAAIYRAYDRIFDCRSHGWANIQSMQLNLPFADDAEFARLHAAVRLLLPILPALAASSPIADGCARAELDFRMECYRLHPARLTSLIGLVIPENVSSRLAYQNDVLAPMYADVAPFDPGGVLRADWLNARGAIPRFDRSAIEIRVIDMQECPKADLAIAALAAAVTRGLYDGRWSALAEQRALSTGRLAATLMACIRAADDALIDDIPYLRALGFTGPPCEAGDLWRHLFEAVSGDPLISSAFRATLEFMLRHGPLAHRIMKALGPRFDRARLATVYRELCDCLAEGRLFAESPA